MSAQFQLHPIQFLARFERFALMGDRAVGHHAFEPGLRTESVVGKHLVGKALALTPHAATFRNEFIGCDWR